MALHRPLRSSFNSLSDDLSRGGNELCPAQFVKIPAAIMINNALGNFELLVICGLCKLNPQCKPIHVTHKHVVQLGCHASRGRPAPWAVISFSAWADRRECRETLSDHGSALACAVADLAPAVTGCPAFRAHVGERGGVDHQFAVMPPSITSSLPVTHEASSEAR
jgi:hypothetical protein